MEPRELLHHIGPTSGVSELSALVDHPAIEEAHVLALLRNRCLSGLLLEALARHERWGVRHAIRAAITNHPKTPRTVALRLLSFLFWNELLRIATNYRLAAPLRTAAERLLRDRLPELELGERITLARAAPPAIIKVLLEGAEPQRVVAALLWNPRLPEVDVVALVESPEAASETLRLVGESSRWSSRYAVALGLVRNPRTPIHVALRALIALERSAVAALVAKHELPPVVRAGAERILAGERIGRR